MIKACKALLRVIYGALRAAVDERDEIIFWILLGLTIAAVVSRYASFTEAAAFVGSSYGFLLAKKHADKRVRD